MDTITTFTEATKAEMNALRQLNYYLDTSKTFNPNNKALIFYRLVFINGWLDRDVTFDFYPQQQLTLDVIVTDTARSQSFALNAYLIYQQTKEDVMPPYELFKIDKNDFVASLTAVLRRVDTLLGGELRPVVAGKQMIKVPVVDLRDFY